MEQKKNLISAGKLKFMFFDLDGTLVDTEPAALKSIRESFADMKIPLEDQDAAWITGRTWDEALDHLYAKYPVPIPREKLDPILIENFKKQIAQDLPVIPGCQEAVRSLSAEYPCALISGSRRAEVLYALRKLGLSDCFKLTLGAEDYVRSKPAPDGYLKAMQLLGAQPSETLVFEDSDAGMQSARDAGAWVCAVLSPNPYRKRMDLAHCKITDFSGVNPDWIRGMTGGF